MTFLNVMSNTMLHKKFYSLFRKSKTQKHVSPHMMVKCAPGGDRHDPMDCFTGCHFWAKGPQEESGLQVFIRSNVKQKKLQESKLVF